MVLKIGKFIIKVLISCKNLPPVISRGEDEVGEEKVEEEGGQTLLFGAHYFENSINPFLGAWPITL